VDHETRRQTKRQQTNETGQNQTNKAKQDDQSTQQPRQEVTKRKNTTGRQDKRKLTTSKVGEKLGRHYHNEKTLGKICIARKSIKGNLVTLNMGNVNLYGILCNNVTLHPLDASTCELQCEVASTPCPPAQHHHIRAC